MFHSGWTTFQMPLSSSVVHKSVQDMKNMFHFISIQLQSHTQHSIFSGTKRPAEDRFRVHFFGAARGRAERRCGGRVGQRERWALVSHSPFMREMTQWLDRGPRCIKETISCSNESVIGTCWRESCTVWQRLSHRSQKRTMPRQINCNFQANHFQLIWWLSLSK